MGKKDRKIPVSEFISDKKLDRILKFIKDADNTEEVYDRVESLLEDDFEVKDLGTNRIILKSKKSKYKDLIFKVAGDSHGIEANFREFYNGDLDKRLTFSYSISKNGVFVVQERVKPLTSKDLEDHKKDIREMLKHLSSKLLLVDCKVKNFKNFGFRSNGDLCLLDHGDTVPLPDYQSNNIVNADEEAYVSLRCKGFKDPSQMKSTKIKPCGGKLKYSKNFDYLECEKCGCRISVNDAYREFYGDVVDAKNNTSNRPDMEADDAFYVWREKIRDYCIQTMDEVENKSNKKDEEQSDMVEKMIKNQKCVQMKGYWIPEHLTKGAYITHFMSVRCGSMTPVKLLEIGKLNPKDYVVTAQDHAIRAAETSAGDDFKPTDKETGKTLGLTAEEAAKKAISIAKNHIRNDGDLPYGYASFKDVFDTENPIDDKFIKNIWFTIKSTEGINRAKFDIAKKRYQIEFTEAPKTGKIEVSSAYGEMKNPNGKKGDKKQSTSEFLVSQQQYLVTDHGVSVCCVKIGNYYVPVDFAKPKMDKDQIKAALRAEGYTPKNFKVDNPETRVMKVNGNVEDDEPKFVSDETDEFEDIADEVAAERLEYEGNEFGSYSNMQIAELCKELEEEYEDSDDDEEDIEDEEIEPEEPQYTNISSNDDRLVPHRKAIEAYKKNVEVADNFFRRAVEFADLADLTTKMFDFIKYGENGTCNITCLDAIKYVNALIPDTHKSMRLQERDMAGNVNIDSACCANMIISNLINASCSTDYENGVATHFTIESTLFTQIKRTFLICKETFEDPDVVINGKCNYNPYSMIRLTANDTKFTSIEEPVDFDIAEYDAIDLIAELLYCAHWTTVGEDLDDEEFAPHKNVITALNVLYSDLARIIVSYVPTSCSFFSTPTYNTMDAWYRSFVEDKVNILKLVVANEGIKDIANTFKTTFLGDGQYAKEFVEYIANSYFAHPEIEGLARINDRLPEDASETDEAIVAFENAVDIINNITSMPIEKAEEMLEFHKQQVLKLTAYIAGRRS